MIQLNSGPDPFIPILIAFSKVQHLKPYSFTFQFHTRFTAIHSSLKSSLLALEIQLRLLVSASPSIKMTLDLLSRISFQPQTSHIFHDQNLQPRTNNNLYVQCMRWLLSRADTKPSSRYLFTDKQTSSQEALPLW